MALVMTRPWKHPTTGIYWLRKAVPADLREALGKREEKFSLKTRDQSEAKIRLSRALADIETRWASLRAGPTTISERQANELADEFYQMFVARYVEILAGMGGTPTSAHCSRGRTPLYSSRATSD